MLIGDEARIVRRPSVTFLYRRSLPLNETGIVTAGRTTITKKKLGMDAGD